MVDDRDSNDSDPGGTPPESDYVSTDEGDFTFDDIYASMDANLLVSSFGDAATSYTCSSFGDMVFSAEGTADPIPIPRNARATLKHPIYGDKWRLAIA